MSQHLFGVRSQRPGLRVTGLVGLLATLLALFLLTPGLTPAKAYADTQPPDAPGIAATVSSDPLDTAQINGVAYAQLVVGTTVYVGGDFQTARPAGAAAGTNTVSRTNLLSYDVTTGALTSWAPNPDGVVHALSLSPDGKTLYVGGNFTHFTGLANVSRYRLAAFTVATGALTSFLPKPDYTVNAVVAVGNSVYFGGAFSNVGGVVRTRLAAVTLAGVLTAWNPVLSKPSTQSSMNVKQLVASPDGTKLVAGGNFTNVNNLDNTGPYGGYGLTMLSASDGSALPLPVNSVVRDAGANSGIDTLVATQSGFYGGGFAYKKLDGNLEGSFRADWNGNLVWVEDCHGDTYSVFPASNGVVYVAGHPHFCGNIGGFPQTSPTWTPQRGIAFNDQVNGTVNPDQYTYYNFGGLPKPTLLNWFPDINVGTYTGLTQGPWSVAGNSDYIVYGGEFTQVNGKNQQGLVRFARAGIAPNADGPRLSGDSFVPTVTQYSSGIRLAWQANYDRDNEQLTYKVIRNNNTAAPLATLTQRSTFYQRPFMSFVDTTAVSGQTYTYKLQVSDPYGNTKTGSIVTVNAATATAPALSRYDQAILTDSPQSFWPLNETSGTSAADIAGNTADPGTIGTSVTPGTTTPGAIAGDAAAPTFAGNVNTSTIATQTNKTALMNYSEEAWFKTTSTKGGKIFGVGTKAAGDSSLSDRQIYLSKAGKVYFGVNPGSFKTIGAAGPAGFNDGKWHQVVATQGLGGLSLYVDGALVDSNTSVYTAWIGTGYFRIGGDYMPTTWPDAPSTGYLTGSVDKAAVYNYPLTAAQVSAHYALKTAPGNQPPTASFTATPTNLSVAFDASASSDSDGQISSYLWDFGDGSSGTGATPTHTYAAPGPVTVQLTVTDNQGATGTTSKTFSVSAANQAPTASFTYSGSGADYTFDASGSSDPDPGDSIASYAWDFGDGTGTGVSPSHSFTASGTYHVKLTVTDTHGGTDSQTQDITVTVPANQPFVSDTFDRTLASGLGSADVGGAWTGGTGTGFAVSGGAGIWKTTAGVTRTAYLGSTLKDSADLTTTFSVDQDQTGGGTQIYVLGRRVSSTLDYRTKVKITSSQQLQVALVATGATNPNLSTTVTFPGTMHAGDQIHVRMQTFGLGSTTVRAKVWLNTDPEPSTWTVQATDSFAGLQAAGAVGFSGYLSSTSTAAENISVLDFVARPVV